MFWIPIRNAVYIPSKAKQRLKSICLSTWLSRGGPCIDVRCSVMMLFLKYSYRMCHFFLFILNRKKWHMRYEYFYSIMVIARAYHTDIYMVPSIGTWHNILRLWTYSLIFSSHWGHRGLRIRQLTGFPMAQLVVVRCQAITKMNADLFTIGLWGTWGEIVNKKLNGNAFKISAARSHILLRLNVLTQCGLVTLYDD